MTENDSRRYFSSGELDKDLIPRMQKLDKFFATTRKYMMEQYGIGSAKVSSHKRELEPEARLHTLTKHPMTFFRALESEKSKQEFLALLHRGLGTNND